jgi:hypothetical protein
MRHGGEGLCVLRATQALPEAAKRAVVTKIHISEALLSINDGSTFEFGVKALARRSVRLP